MPDASTPAPCVFEPRAPLATTVATTVLLGTVVAAFFTFQSPLHAISLRHLDFFYLSTFVVPESMMGCARIKTLDLRWIPHLINININKYNNNARS